MVSTVSRAEPLQIADFDCTCAHAVVAEKAEKVIAFYKGQELRSPLNKALSS